MQLLRLLFGGLERVESGHEEKSVIKTDDNLVNTEEFDDDELDLDIASDDEEEGNAEKLAVSNRDYIAIVNSSKYADSNSNTKDLEKLLSLVNIKKEGDGNDVVVKENNLSKDKQLVDKNCEENENKISIESIICHDGDNDLLPGQPCYQPAKFGKEGGINFNLGKFDVPRRIMMAIKANDVEALKLSSPMTMDNYVHRFQTLLWIEEAQQAIEMRRYDMYDVMLAKLDDYFLLEVPGLAEGRPSLLRGDRLILRSDKRQSYYEGYIHEVREKDILFRLHEHLHSTAMDGLRFTIQFLNSRTPFRRSHHGVCQYRDRSDIKSIVFPFPPQATAAAAAREFKVMIRLDPALNEQTLKTFNEELNFYQKRAVLNVLRATCRPAPYIIFGPPGTGKTVTLVEATLQVYARQRDFKILVCANSNSSADICAQRIKNSGIVKDGELLRVSAFYRMAKLIPPELESITKDMDLIDSYLYERSRIIVTTCIQSGSLYEFKERFDYIFIDEAGHASEPEVMIALGLLNPSGCLALAGDPHQLGPICISQVANQYGLGLSLLERLCKRSIYSRTLFRHETEKMDYNDKFITLLRICYRCDSRLLSINNEMFYNNDLKFVNKTPVEIMQLFHTNYPLIFHSVQGRDKREYTNPSWFNPSESIRCLSYAKRLYEFGLKPEQLGIITPYRRQIEKLNLLFDSCRLAKCKIATMEEFQGDEREVILISTVRTRERKLEFDKKFQLGFLFNPRRFNVSISRAKWLVIVVGDERILSRDPHWSRYINDAHKFQDK